MAPEERLDHLYPAANDQHFCKEVKEDDNAKASDERDEREKSWRRSTRKRLRAELGTITPYTFKDDVDYGKGVRGLAALFPQVECGEALRRGFMQVIAAEVYRQAGKFRSNIYMLFQYKHMSSLSMCAHSAKTKAENAAEGKIDKRKLKRKKPAAPSKESETQGRAYKNKVTAKDFVDDEARQGLNNTNDNEEDEEEDDDGGGDEEASKEKATAEQIPKGKAAREKAAREKAACAKAAREKTACEKAAKEKAAEEKAAKEKAAKEKAAASKSDKDKSADEEDDADDGDEDDEEATDKDEVIVHAAKEQAAKARAGKAANTKAAKEQAAKERAAKDACTTAAKNKASQQLVARNEESPSPEDEVQGFFQFKDEDAVLLWSSKSKVLVAEGTVEVKSLSEEEECRVHNTVLKAAPTGYARHVRCAGSGCAFVGCIGGFYKSET
eukprot:jgi/Chlat1/7189/Chrsp57S06844